MTMDSVRAIGQVTREETKKKYEETYLQEFEKLLPYGSDKESYEERIVKIIDVLKGERQYYIASFPFFNKTNSQFTI